MMSASPPDGFALIKPGQTYLGQQGIVYGACASKETVGAQKICMNVMPMPAGAVAKAHYHKNIETIAYMRAGEQCFCDSNIPHAPRNESGEPCTWIVVHSSGSDQDGIVLLPELDRELAQRLAGKG